MAMKRIETDDAMQLEWELENVTPKMIDWFWSNMEKCMLLWHPSQHEPLEWAVAPVHGNPIGSVHIAPQTWNDGTRQNLYIQLLDITKIPSHIQSYITHEHAVVVCCIGMGEEALTNPQHWGYRIHQWSKADCGVAGSSTAIGALKQENHEDKLNWADHCEEEIGNWAVFLPSLYSLYQVVTNTKYNPYTDLSVEKKENSIKYKYINI
ncbi:MAG: hypothetical protein PVI90_04605 [Desulfobacteraceae bacterium]|jgi:hypothetical protein